MYRKLTQVLDLISLDLKMHEMKRQALALAVLILGLMQKFDILSFDENVNLDELCLTISQFINSDQDLAL